MRRFYLLSFLPLFSAFFLFSNTSRACGYDFIGDCSTRVHLRINGTTDSFFVAACPFGIPFSGLDFGNIQSLSLVNAHAETWESCQNNVTNVALFYRVYETGQSGGAWQLLNLAEESSSTQGAYTTRFRGAPANVNLAAGLVIGKTYTLEVFFRADVDTIGNDYIPETFYYQNNAGQNYKLSFTYGGASAPPFTVLTTRKRQPSCFGGNNGAVGVSVYGNPPGLFYAWAGFSNNFYTLENVPAGTYTVTVSEAGGYAAVQTIVLGQPQVLAAQFTDVHGIDCAGAGLGSATAVISGGTAPYTYAWQNGQAGPTASFAAAGSWALTVTDAHSCTAVFSVNIGSGILVEINRVGEICPGEFYVFGGYAFNTPGQYEIPLNSNGGCDTLVHLLVAKLDPALTLAALPEHITLTCSAPALNLCASAAPSTTFLWDKDGIPAPNGPCLLATAGGAYHVKAVQSGLTKSCSAEKFIQSEEHLIAPALTAHGMAESLNPCHTLDSVRINFKAVATPATGATFSWKSNGQVIGTGDSISLIFYGSPNDWVLPTARVEAYGCVNEATATYVLVQYPSPPFLFVQNYSPDYCTGLINVEYDILGGILPLLVEWEDTTLTTGSAELTLAPGQHTVTITDGDGCTVERVVQVHESNLYVIIDNASSSSSADGDITLNPDFYFPSDRFQWSNGASGYYLHDLLPGTYCVTITDNNGCTQDTCFTVSYPNAVQESGKPVELHFYPNPAFAGETVAISSPAISPGNNYTVSLSDLAGRPILKTTKMADNQEIKCEIPRGLAGGIYLIEVGSMRWKGQFLLLAR